MARDHREIGLRAIACHSQLGLPDECALVDCVCQLADYNSVRLVAQAIFYILRLSHQYLMTYKINYRLPFVIVIKTSYN